MAPRKSTASQGPSFVQPLRLLIRSRVADAAWRGLQSVAGAFIPPRPASSRARLLRIIRRRAELPSGRFLNIGFDSRCLLTRKTSRLALHCNVMFKVTAQPLCLFVSFQLARDIFVIQMHITAFTFFHFQLDPFYASIILFVGRAWDAVTDPTVGFLVSRSPWTRFGRMLPWYVLAPLSSHDRSPLERP